MWWFYRAVDEGVLVVLNGKFAVSFVRRVGYRSGVSIGGLFGLKTRIP